MRDSWGKSTIGELCDQGQALIQTGPFGSQLHAHDYEPIGVPVVPTEAIGRRRLRTEGLPKVSTATAERLSRHKLKEGDILFARRGVQATGLSAIVEKEHEGWLCGTGAILLRLNSPDVDAEFLSFALSSETSTAWLKSHAVGAVMPNLNEGVIRRFPLLLPPIAEQQSIAHILGALDDKIELNRRMNETLEATARALFKSWFVDFDPVRAKAEKRQPAGMEAETAALFPSSFEDSPLGLIPRSWTHKRMSDFLQLEKGLSYKGDFLSQDGMPMINLGCFISSGRFSIENLKFYRGDFRDRHIVRTGDIVIANTDITQKREVLGSPAIIPPFENQYKFLFTHHVFAVRINPDYEHLKLILFFSLLQPSFRERAVGFATGTTVLALPKDAVLNHALVLPDANLVNAFNDKVEPLLALSYQNIEQSRTLAALRDALLPKLLSGEIRVREAEREVEQVA